MVWHVHWVQPLGDSAPWLARGPPNTRSWGHFPWVVLSTTKAIDYLLRRFMMTSWYLLRSTHGRCLCIQSLVVSTTNRFFTHLDAILNLQNAHDSNLECARGNDSVLTSIQVLPPCNTWGGLSHEILMYRIKIF